MSLTGRSLVAAMCAGQVGNLLPHVVVPAIMAEHLIPLWGLSGAQAGLMAGAYAFGYMLAVPLLTTLTDRIDARYVLLVGSALSGIATAAFGLFAEGLWSAVALWALAGVGFAGAYMPGLKALTDRLPPRESSRSITLYTSSFSVGVGLSFLVSQLVAARYGWRAAFLATALGPLIMIAVCLAMTPFRPAPAAGRLLDFRPVFRNRPALGYVLGYGAHCFELYGFRTWIVAFWTFVVARSGDAALFSAVTVSVIATFLSLPASILGNEAAIRFGRHRAITLVMFLSGAVALAIGFSAGRVAAMAARTGVDLRRHHPGGLRRAHIGHGGERRPRQSRGDHGAAFDRRLRPLRARRLGRRHRARRGGRAREPERLARGIHRVRGRRAARALGAVVGKARHVGRHRAAMLTRAFNRRGAVLRFRRARFALPALRRPR